MNKCPKNYSKGGIEIECPYAEKFPEGGKTNTNCFCAASTDQCYYWRNKKYYYEVGVMDKTIDDIILEKGGKKRVVEKEVKEEPKPKQNKMRLIEVEDEQG